MPRGNPTTEDHIEGKVLITAPFGRDSAILSAVLAEEDIPTLACPSLESLCAGIEGSAAAAIVAEEVLDDRAQQRLLATLDRQPDWSDFPVIVMAAAHGFERLRHVTGWTHAIVIERPVRKVALLSTVRAALRSRARQYQVREELDRRRQAEDALHRSDRRKDEFLATLSHELRNPLAPIVTGLELLKHSTDPTQIGAIRDTMDRQTRQLVRLIDDLLDVSRITRGQLQLQRTAVRVDEFVMRAIEQCRTYIEQRGHHLQVDMPDDTLHIDGDPSRLTQIVANLLNNAAKYTGQGGDIELAVRPCHDAVEISIRDNGLGVPAGSKDDIFHMFARGRQPTDTSPAGLGVGLALVKSLVELHGGTVGVRSEGENRGSEFRVSLPVLAAPSESGDNGSSLPAAAHGPSRRVLVVDDSEQAADMLKQVVELLGHDVRTAYDGKSAIEHAAAFRPNIILMDLGMPVMDGYDAARYIRTQPWGREMALVALTGWGQREDRVRTRDAGFDDHLVKPVTSDQLRRVFSRPR